MEKYCDGGQNSQRALSARGRRRRLENYEMFDSSTLNSIYKHQLIMYESERWNEVNLKMIWSGIKTFNR